MDPAATFPDALIVGVVLGAAVAWLSYRLHWLDLSGAVAAAAIGAAVFATGKMLTVALIFFFLSSHLLERAARAGTLTGDASAQPLGPRNAVQVVAAGGVPALAAVGILLGGGVRCADAALAAIAFATADTWATGVGMTAPRPPRLLGFGPRIARGLSGGMSLRGTIASALGAVAIGLFAAGLSARVGPVSAGKIAALGLAGALLDSILGATVQKRYRCAGCGRETETDSHCGTPTVRRRGVLSNAGVNLACALAVGMFVLLA
jgi:uncharacterized protein (TIGR00297 family)